MQAVLRQLLILLDYLKWKRYLFVSPHLGHHREPDLSFVLDTARTIAPHLAKGVLVTLESTTYPGTTEDELRLVLEEGSGMQAGVDFHLAYSPEREDPCRRRCQCKNNP